MNRPYVTQGNSPEYKDAWFPYQQIITQVYLISPVTS